MSAGSSRKGSKTLSQPGKLKDQPQNIPYAGPEEPKVSQWTLDRTKKERDELKKNLDASLRDCARLNLTVYNITKKVIETTNPSKFQTEEEKDPRDVSEEELIAMIGNLRPAEKNMSLEARLEELETRITLLNSELGKLIKLKMSMEGSLKELDSCQNLDTLQQTIKMLWLQSYSTKLFVKDSLHLKEHQEKQESSFSQDVIKTNGVQINLQKVEIAPPSGKREAGDTHIQDMQLGLRQLVIQELSLCKGNGCDWRMFAQRIGITPQMIQQWKEMKMPQPMKNVLAAWATSPAATVRMLHRHLVSPQMRCVILGKRISDYYEVD